MTDVLLISLDTAAVGTLSRGTDGRVEFRFLPDYLSRPNAPVLGQWFLDNPGKAATSKARLPPWFSNTLPEGALRALVAEDLDVSVQREFDLLARVGEDLPGAVRATPFPEGLGLQLPADLDEPAPMTIATEGALKFSLAGVQLKFSMLLEGKKLTLPTRGVGGDWLVKLPDARFSGVPRNEFAMMNLARAAGIEVPDVMLVGSHQLEGLPPLAPLPAEDAYAVRRYDRTPTGRVHQEDFAQVLNEYPERKYKAANYETIANVVVRTLGHDALRAFLGRLVFNIAIGNGDAHLKNWSLLYPGGVRPELAPAYDLVSTILYIPGDLLGLNLARSKAWEDVRRTSFTRLAGKVGVSPTEVRSAVDDAVTRFEDAWATESAHLPLSTDDRARLDSHRARIPLFNAEDRGAA